MLLIIPFFLICMGIEYIYGRYKGKKYYRFNDTITNLNLGVANQIFSLLTKGMLFGTFIWIYNKFAIFDLSMSLVNWLLCLVLFDFLYYWAHRWSHEVNFLWGAHVVHHQSEDYNLGVALRQSWIHTFIAAFIFFPIPILGFEPVIFIGVSGVVTLYQFWIHTEAITRLPKWFEFIFNSPTHHRVHHARDPKYIDKNYAATFILWDRIFGTYMEEEERPHYGITTQINSWNPTWANLHYYTEMWQSATKMSNWKDKLRIIFARPGWLPKDLGGFQAPPPVNPNESKYNSDNQVMRIYVTVQFLLIIIGLMAYSYHFDNLSVFFQISLAIILILSTMICGAIMDNKKWVWASEYVILFLALLCVNTLYYYFYMDWFTIMLVGSSIGFLVLTIWFTLSIYQNSLLKKPTGY